MQQPLQREPRATVWRALTGLSILNSVILSTWIRGKDSFTLPRLFLGWKVFVGCISLAVLRGDIPLSCSISLLLDVISALLTGIGIETTL